MACIGFARITGEKQGEIKGGSVYEDREGLIDVIAFDHTIEVPHQSGSALAVGRAQHLDLVITKLVDRASPRLQQALLMNERLSEVRFEWYQRNEQGREELFYAIELKNALITRLQPFMPSYLDPAQDRYRFMEKVSFAYETIVWAYGARGEVQFEASWRGDKK